LVNSPKLESAQVWVIAASVKLRAVGDLATAVT
jgi:hypothetical protein